jgi:hypothetical protein
MRTLEKSLKELHEAGGWSHLDIYNLMLELTGNDEIRLNLMLLDIEKLMDVEKYKLDVIDVKEKRDGIEPDYLALMKRSSYWVLMVRVRRAIRDQLNLDFMQRVHENQINWLRDEPLNRAFVEALIMQGYISNKKYHKICGNFIDMRADEETEFINWMPSQRLLIMMVNYLIDEGIIGSTDNKWMMLSQHFTWKGRELKTDSLNSDSNYLYQSKEKPKGWAKLKGMIDETLRNFA